ncbi:MAG: hypothetical protein ACOCWC_05885, partial [Bacteroidota bacterium]
MTIIIIDRPITKEEYNDVAHQLKNQYGSFIINNTDVDYKGLKEEAIEVYLDSHEKKQIHFDCIEIIKEESLKYDKIFYNVLPGFHFFQYHRFRLYYDLRKIRYITYLINKVRSKHPKATISCYTDKLNLKYYFKSNKKNLKITFNNKKDNINSKRNYNYYAIIIMRIIYGYFSYLKNSRAIKKTKHAFIDFVIRQNILSLDGEYEIKHPKLDYLFQSAKSCCAPLFINEVRMNKKKKYLFKSYYWRNNTGGKRIFGEIIIFNFLLKLKNLMIVMTLYKKLGSVIREIENPKTGEGLHVYSIIKNNQKMIFFYMVRFLAYQEFFSSHKHISTITTTDEHGPFARSILDAASYIGVKTIGIQHGNINQTHPSYQYSKEEVKSGVLPDLTLVWGEAWKRILVDYGNYPGNSVKVTGQIRTDIIPLLNNKKRISSGKSLIVFASQPQPDPDLRRRAAEDVFKAFKGKSDVQLSIKLHPNEYEDKSYYDKIATYCGNENYYYADDDDLYELISECSALITCYSTVGTEVIYFYKPLIVLDHLK